MEPAWRCLLRRCCFDAAGGEDDLHFGKTRGAEDGAIVAIFNERVDQGDAAFDGFLFAGLQGEFGGEDFNLDAGFFHGSGGELGDFEVDVEGLTGAIGHDKLAGGGFAGLAFEEELADFGWRWRRRGRRLAEEVLGQSNAGFERGLVAFELNASELAVGRGDGRRIAGDIAEEFPVALPAFEAGGGGALLEIGEGVGEFGFIHSD